MVGALLPLLLSLLPPSKPLADGVLDVLVAALRAARLRVDTEEEILVSMTASTLTYKEETPIKATVIGLTGHTVSRVLVRLPYKHRYIVLQYPFQL